MQDTAAHRPAASDHEHEVVPVDTAFEFLNTLDLENGALVEQLTSLDVAADWLSRNGVVGDPALVRRLGEAGKSRAVLNRIVRTRTALRDVAHAVAHEEPPRR